MVKVIEKFRDEISGKIFDNIEDAIKSENKSVGIKEAFAFYVPIIDEDLDFANGNFCIQRKEEFYNKIIFALIDTIKKYEPYIAKEYNKIGLTKDNIKGYSFLGRYLDNGDSQLYKWWTIQASICPVCFREYGQIAFALKCSHDNKIRRLGE